jgi:ATP-binding cassette subfamily B (MDR/TAP) protein 1
VPNLKNFAEGCTAAYKVFQMIDRVPAIDSEDLSGQKLENVEGNIELRNVSFRYPGGCAFPLFVVRLQRME